MTVNTKIIISIILYVSINVYAQNDSLLNILKSQKDIEKAVTYNLLARSFIKSNPQKSIEYINKSIEFSTKFKQNKETAQSYVYMAVINKRATKFNDAKNFYTKAIINAEIAKDTMLLSKAYNGLAQVNYNTGNYKAAINWINKAIKYKDLVNDKHGEAVAYNTLGNIYNEWGKKDSSIISYQKSLKIFEESGNLYGISANLNAIGVIYEVMANFTDINRFNQALDYYNQALKINLKLNDKIEIANSYNNIGNINSQIFSHYNEIIIITNNNTEVKKLIEEKNKAYEKAEKNLLESKIIREEIDDIRGIISSEINLGRLYLDTNKTNIAINHFEKAYKSTIKTNDIYNSIICLHHLATAYRRKKIYNKALKYAYDALKLAKEKKILKLEKDITNELSKIYEKKRNFKKSLDFKKKYITLSDSILISENSKLVEDLNKKYETDKKEAQIKLQNSELKKKELENRQQEMLIYGFSVVFLLILGVIVLIYRQYKHKKKANEKLEAKNKLITNQKKEITDSILYAKRIQTAILPQGDYIQETLPERFILFKPRDIVSGDFYWLKDINNEDTVICTAADCTGHGVPGAFMSMLGVAFLNEIIARPGIKTTGEVLNKLRESVIKSLHQTGREGETKDGMDISFVAINYKTYIVQFSGANNPLYVIRENNKNEIICDKKIEGNSHTLYEIKGDKMPIGIYRKDRMKGFKTIEIQLEKGDLIYLFSDGYADQFGGPEGKKFKYKPFKKLILDNCTKSMNEQSEILNTTIENWKGNLEQVDDIILIGIKL